jgi:predicted aldo/keto reductase-like oxidoreductase
MKEYTRRKFVKTTIAGSLAVSTGLMCKSDPAVQSDDYRKLGFVQLGKSGIITSRVAFGTGSNGWKKVSDQTKIGLKGFVALAEYVYDKGIIFFDVADIYGSHEYLREALKIIPREKVVIMSKLWTRDLDWMEIEDVPKTLDRFRKEIGTDYLDIALLHCQTSANWIEEEKKRRDDLSEAKQKGIIKSHGVSCHDFGAMQAAAASDWVEILLARINHTGAHMDGPPNAVMTVLKQAHDRGAGVIGMKIYGCGKLTKERQRQKSLEYVWGSGNVDAMTIGINNSAQVDDTLTRISKILRA